MEHYVAGPASARLHRLRACRVLAALAIGSVDWLCVAGLVGERLGSVLKHRLQHGEHRQGDPRLLDLFRLRSTGLGVAVGAIRSCRGRYRPRASPRSPNGPTRARLKPPGSPAATRSNAFRPLEKKRCVPLSLKNVRASPQGARCGRAAGRWASLSAALSTASFFCPGSSEAANSLRLTLTPMGALTG